MPKTQDVLARLNGVPLEEVACYLCGRTDGPVLMADDPFFVRRCAGCGLGYTSPRVRADCLADLYRDTYFSSERAEQFGYSSYEADLDAYLKTFRAKARWVRSLAEPGRLLEVGCAAGAFLKAMAELGFEAHGLEISPAMVDLARSKLGLERVQVGVFREGLFPDAHFDLLAMFDVVEHLPDPLVELRLAHRLLRPGGRLILQTQNLESMARRLLRERWPHFKQLEHVYHFSPSTIETLLARAGFEDVRIRTRSAGKHVSFSDIADRAHRLGGIPRLLCRPIELLGRRSIYLNLGDEMLVSARSRSEA